MHWKIYYLEEAKLDIKEAKDWYGIKSLALAERFIKHLKSAVNSLLKNPLHYEIRYKNFRIKHVDVFPFGIHYYLDEDLSKIIIIAVLHHSRNPGTSKDREL